MAKNFDIVVIGGGPGGYVAAIRAAQLGFSVALVEAQDLGGICLNWGCIPTKALLRSAEIYRHIQKAEEFGLDRVENPSFDLQKIVARSRQVSKRLNNGVGMLLKKNKVTVIKGWAVLAGASPDNNRGDMHHHIEIYNDSKGREDAIMARYVIIASGARARAHPTLPADKTRIWSYREALLPDKMPNKLLVVGSGAIGIEFASFYKTMGADVTVVEMAENILPAEDKEISTFAKKMLTQQGMQFFTAASVDNIDHDKATDIMQAHIKTTDGKTTTLICDKIIVAIGIQGNVEGMGLENYPDIQVEKTHIKVNEWAETGVKNIYAIGDVTGPPWLAHKAEHEGVIAIEKIALDNNHPDIKNIHPLNHANIPGCTYCHPQIASVGLSEAAAKAAGYDIKVGRFPFIANGKAIALGEDEGMIKVIFDAKTGELLGAHMIGAEVTELIQGYGIACALETTEAELMHTIFPHPTLSEMMHEAVLNAYNKAIHI